MSLLLVTLTVLTTTCAAPQRQAESSPPSSGPSEPRQSQTLQIPSRREVTNLAPKLPGDNDPNATRRPFNAALALIDASGTARPYLAAALPQLNTDAWRIFPDGRMETIYRLREGLTWHDGAPLSADDFAFAFRAYREPALGFTPSPENLMEAVLAPDDRTVVVQWKGLYVNAGALSLDDLVPLPRHLLETAFRQYQDGGLAKHFSVVRTGLRNS